MSIKTLLVFFVLVLLVSGVVAASVDYKKSDKKTEYRVIDDKKTDDRKDDKKLDKKTESPETGDNDANDRDDNAGGTETESGGVKMSPKKHDTSAQVVSMEALKGLSTTDLFIHVPLNVTAANKVQVKAYYTNGTLKFTRNYFDKPASNGIISLQFDDLSRWEKVEVRLKTDPYDWFEGAAMVFLRPDLTVTSVSVPEKVPAGSIIPVNITVQELNGDMGAEAVISLTDGITVLGTGNVNLRAGGTAGVNLSAIINSTGNYNLSIKITGVVPADYNETNNIYGPLAVKVISSDLAVTNVNAPADVAVGQGFQVLATISELNGETGANATVALVWNSVVLDSKTLDVPAGGSVSVSLNGSLGLTGSHNLTVRIISSSPPDAITGNNERIFVIHVLKPPEPMSFTSNYYYQNSSIYRSRYITGSDYVEKGEEHESREDEVVSFTASSNRSLSFPLRINISILNETGNGNIFTETGVVPTGVESSRKIFTKHYNDSETTITIGVGEIGVSVNIDSKANSSVKHSSGYKYWWFGKMDEWNVTTNSSSGKPVRARETLHVRIELEDSSRLLGGNTVTILGNVSYTGGWVNTDDGRVEEQTKVWIYSGAASGNTVI